MVHIHEEYVPHWKNTKQCKAFGIFLIGF